MRHPQQKLSNVATPLQETHLPSLARSPIETQGSADFMYLIWSYLTFSQLSYLSFLLLPSIYLHVYLPSIYYLSNYLSPASLLHATPHVHVCCSTIPLTSLWLNHRTKQSESSAKGANSKPNMTQTTRWTSFQNTLCSDQQISKQLPWQKTSLS